MEPWSWKRRFKTLFFTYQLSTQLTCIALCSRNKLEVHKSLVWIADGNWLTAQFALNYLVSVNVCFEFNLGWRRFDNAVLNIYVDDIIRRELVVNQQIARPFCVVKSCQRHCHSAYSLNDHNPGFLGFFFDGWRVGFFFLKTE